MSSSTDSNDNDKDHTTLRSMLTKQISRHIRWGDDAGGALDKTEVIDCRRRTGLSCINESEEDEEEFHIFGEGMDDQSSVDDSADAAGMFDVGLDAFDKDLKDEYAGDSDTDSTTSSQKVHRSWSGVLVHGFFGLGVLMWEYGKGVFGRGNTPAFAAQELTMEAGLDKARDLVYGATFGGGEKKAKDTVAMQDMSYSEVMANSLGRTGMGDSTYRESTIRKAVTEKLAGSTGFEMVWNYILTYVAIVLDYLQRLFCNNDDPFDLAGLMERKNSMNLVKVLVEEMATEATQTVVSSVATGTTTAASVGTATTAGTTLGLGVAATGQGVSGITATLAGASVVSQTTVAAVGAVTMTVVGAAAVASSATMIKQPPIAPAPVVESPYAWIKHNCSGDTDELQDIFDVKQGFVEMGFLQMTAEILFQGRDILEEAFMESYNELGFMCDGPFERIMHNVTLLPGHYLMTDAYGDTFAFTQWRAIISCIGCDDHEPLFWSGTDSPSGQIDVETESAIGLVGSNINAGYTDDSANANATVAGNETKDTTAGIAGATTTPLEIRNRTLEVEEEQQHFNSTKTDEEHRFNDTINKAHNQTSQTNQTMEMPEYLKNTALFFTVFIRRFREKIDL